VLARMANWFFQDRANYKHRLHVHFIFKIATIKTSFSQWYKNKQFSLEYEVRIADPFVDELLLFLFKSYFLLH
jgi:hypothetical protein